MGPEVHGGADAEVPAVLYCHGQFDYQKFVPVEVIEAQDELKYEEMKDDVNG